MEGSTFVNEVMTKTVLTADKSVSIQDVAQKMKENRMCNYHRRF